MKLTIFDLDNTILRGDSDYSWIEFLIEKEIVDVKKYKDKNAYFFNQYNQGTLDIYEYSSFAIGSFIEIGKEKISVIFEEYLSSVIEPMINVYALRLIHEHYENNDELLLASATNKILVDIIAKRLDFKNVIATIPETVGGELTGRIIKPAALGEGKLELVREWMLENNFINFDGTTFYSDSINDLPLLCAVEKAVGVNPDSKLRHECISRGWEIIDLP